MKFQEDTYLRRQATIDRHTLRMLRRRGGYLLRQRRMFLGLTQQELAERVGLDTYTIVSRLESSIGRIEPYQYEQWAQALELPISKLVARVLEHTDPVAPSAIREPGTACPLSWTGGSVATMVALAVAMRWP